ncbi:MAG: NAD(P)-binding domain-containing protein [Terrimesophilobacter sp.]
MLKYAIVGAGPSGLAGARNLSKLGIDFDGFESAGEAGGLWNIDNPRSTMYDSAHLISSKTTTEFTEFPMAEGTPDYPGHKVLCKYFTEFAHTFDLLKYFRFNTEVTSVERVNDGWKVSWKSSGGAGAATTGSAVYAGVVLANGTLAAPSIPAFPGTFDGEILHSSQYKSPEIFRGKRVLIIGAGNSGCDIAVDAVHHAHSIDMSVRRGYYFVPRYMLGKPTDTLNQGRPLPARIKQAVDSRLLKLFTGDPVRFGFPQPDYRIYESHPIVNTLVLQHLGQGDLQIRPDIDRFEGHTVHFSDGTSDDYDLIMLATGYVLDYPFIDHRHLNWTGMAPTLFLNMFGADAGSSGFNGIYVLGMVEASGLGWQGRYEQAELLARYLAADKHAQHDFESQAEKPWPDLTGGYRYLALERMSFYVNKDAYRREVKKNIRKFRLRKQRTKEYE